MAAVGGIVAMLAVVGVVGAYLILRPTGMLTVKLGADNARALASSVGADGIAEQQDGVFAKVTITFEEVRLKDSSTGQWTTVKTPNGHFDIIAMADKNGGTVHAEVLVQATVPQGTYDEIVLVVNGVEVYVKVGTIEVKASIQVNNRELHLQGPITVDANGVILLVVIDITRSFTPVGAGYGFTPIGDLSVEG
jgi:hypothetical protein